MFQERVEVLLGADTPKCNRPRFHQRQKMKEVNLGSGCPKQVPIRSREAELEQSWTGSHAESDPG